MPVVDPHLVQATIVHEPFDNLTTDSRVYTASLAVHHYYQLFSSRTSGDILTSDGMLLRDSADETLVYCADDSMSHVSGIVKTLLEGHPSVT